MGGGCYKMKDHMRNTVNWAMRVVVCWVMCATVERVFAGDPILFYSSAQTILLPRKQVDLELVRVVEAPQARTPSQAAYSATEPDRQTSRRANARRLAAMKHRQKSESNWLVGETTESDLEGGWEDELGDEELALPLESEGEFRSGGIDGEQERRTEQVGMIQRARFRTDLARETVSDKDLSVPADLRSLTSLGDSAGGGPYQQGLPASSVGSGLDLMRWSGPSGSAAGSSAPSRFLPSTGGFNPGAGASFSGRGQSGPASPTVVEPPGQPKRATEWGVNALGNPGAPQQAPIDRNEPTRPAYESLRRLGR